MKRMLITSATILVLLLCLAIGVSASDIYSDFTKPGVNGEPPVFACLGYAIDESEGNICIDYTVDIDALEAYEKATGKKLNYGFVVAHGKNLVDGKPLDKDGKPAGEKIYTINLNNNSSIISVVLKGLDTTLYDEEIVISLYVKEENGVKYIFGEESKDAPVSVTYDKIRGPREVTVDGMVYSTDGVTEPAADRIKQKAYSDSVYNKGSNKTDAELKGSGWLDIGILGKAKLIAAGGSLINMPAASSFMSHYLKNTGATYTIDVPSFLSDDSGALNSRNKAINKALRAAEQLAEEGRTITINQLAEGHPMQWELATQNWQYAIGSYFDDVDVINLTVTEVDGVKTYSADIKYIVTDYYNWDTNDYNEFKGIVSPHDLHELHKAGLAREFLSYGEYTYTNVTWTEGQVATEISALN